jgi:hypothetical protein
MITPAASIATKGWVHGAQWRELPGGFGAIASMRRYIRGSGLADSRAAREARIRDCFTRAFKVLGHDQDPAMYQVAIEEVVTKILDSTEAGSPPSPA